ncbi:MAG: NADPH:quinone reductase [Alphaproteobacteria bacterium]
MRIAYYEQNGSAADVLKLGAMDDPRPRPGEVRVRLKTSGVNPSDVKTRAGLTRKMAFPRVIPQSDGAGDIDMVGDGVPAARMGERVWIWNGQWKRPHGTAAEYIAVPADHAVRLPASTSYEAGACLGIPALTAWQALDLAEAGRGKTLLIAGGAGAVAHYAIQLAKLKGATTIATVSSPAKAKVAREAGADHVIDYKTENVGDRVGEITGKAGVDAVIEVDLTANAALLPRIVRPRGTVVVYGTGAQAQLPASFCLVSSIRLLFMLVYELAGADRARALADITRLLEENRLKHNVAATFGLDQIVAAHEAQEQAKTIGNIVLKIG